MSASNRSLPAMAKVEYAANGWSGQMQTSGQVCPTTHHNDGHNPKQITVDLAIVSTSMLLVRRKETSQLER